MDHFGERLARLRKDAKLTQEQVAERCGVSAQAVSKWENGSTYPDILLLKTLADLFQISCDELLGRESTVYLNDSGRKMKLLKIKVRDDSSTTNLNIPAEAVKLLISDGGFWKGIQNDILEKIDFSKLLQMVDIGVAGKLLPFEDGEDSVEIWVE